MISETMRDIEMRVAGVCLVYALVAPVEYRIRGMSVNFDIGDKYDKCHPVKYVKMVWYRNENCWRLLRFTIYFLIYNVSFGDRL